MQNKHKRLAKALDFIDKSNNEIAKIMNYKSRQKIADLRTGNQKITPEIALEFELKFNINKIWIIFNEGDMFIEEDIKLKKLQDQAIKDLFKKDIENIMAQLEKLKDKI